MGAASRPGAPQGPAARFGPPIAGRPLQRPRALPVEESTADPVRIRGSEDAAAQASTEFKVRQAHRFSMDYRRLAAELSTRPGKVFRLGCFETLGIPPDEPFATFTITDSPLIRGAHLPHARLAHHGNKIHLNVDREDLPGAWEALQPLLLSRDNPYVQWKMTMLENTERWREGCLEWVSERERAGDPNFDAGRKRREACTRARRITEGMQFTLYPFTNVRNPHYSAEDARFRQFLQMVDEALAETCVRPGTIPESDVTIEGLYYASYRNENIGSRGPDAGEPPITREMLNDLRRTPFYKAIQR